MNSIRARYYKRSLTLLGLLLVPLCATSAQASDSRMGWYVAGQYGTATSSCAELDLLNGVSGTVMAAQLGYFLSDRFAIEGMFRNTNFKASSADYIANSLVTLTLNSKMKATDMGVGVRELFFTYFNLNFGFFYRSVDPAVTTTSSIASLNLPLGTKTTGAGYYAGIGAQLPLGAIDLMADYTLNKFAADVYAKEITGGLRLHL